jgi:hypothetical protein
MRLAALPLTRPEPWEIHHGRGEAGPYGVGASRPQPPLVVAAGRDADGVGTVGQSRGDVERSVPDDNRGDSGERPPVFRFRAGAGDRKQVGAFKMTVAINSDIKVQKAIQVGGRQFYGSSKLTGVAWPSADVA